MSAEPVRILFVCARNQWRSPTAEAIYRRDGRVKVRSAGVASSARRTVKPNDLEWADWVVAMDDDHARRLKPMLRTLRRAPTLHTLGIPDDYRYMDPELIDMIRRSVDALLDAS